MAVTAAQQSLLIEVKQHPKFDRFISFHLQNPRVYEYIRDLALERRARGFTKCGINALVEKARWDLEMEAGPDGEPFKINNDFGPMYARMLAVAYPELGQDFFEFRRTEKKQAGALHA